MKTITCIVKVDKCNTNLVTIVF